MIVTKKGKKPISGREAMLLDAVLQCSDSGFIEGDPSRCSRELWFTFAQIVRSSGGTIGENAAMSMARRRICNVAMMAWVHSI